MSINAHMRLTLLLMALAMNVAAADLSQREQQVTGNVTDDSPKVYVTVKGDDATPGCEREYLVDVTYPANATPGTPGTFTQNVRYFPGKNTVNIYSATSQEKREPTFKVDPPALKIRLQWAGNDHDYDLYVNEINWTSKTSAEGNLDRDAYAGSDTGEGVENIVFPKAKPGVYCVYVNYYSDHGNEGADPTKVTIQIGNQTIFTQTKTISEDEGHGGSLEGTGKSVWSVATVVIHGADAGGYRVVDENWNEVRLGYRDIFTGQDNKPIVRQGNSPGIFPRTNFTIAGLDGPNGTNRVVIAKGQSVQFYANGTVNTEGNVEQCAILGKFHSSDTGVGTIDELGVLTGIKGGKTTVTTDSGSGSIDVYVVDLRMLADTDRDGAIDNDKDRPLKSVASRSRGAIFNVNFNDSDGDGESDAVSYDENGLPVLENNTIENEADIADISPIRFVKTGVALPGGAALFLKVKDAVQVKSFHLFTKRKAGETGIWGGMTADGGPTVLEIDASSWINATADVEAGLEGLRFRSTGTLNTFHGKLEFTYELRDGGTVVAKDELTLKVAPWLILPHTRPSQEMWLLNDPAFGLPGNPAFVADLAGAGPLKTLTGADTDDNQWIQDQAEIGYTQRPGATPQHVSLAMPFGVIPPWLTTNLLAPTMGVFQFGDMIAHDSGPSGGTKVAGSFGGNLECVPATSKWPLGRMLVGDTMPNDFQEFLKSQEVQSPISVATQWLDVGHVDELIGFTGVGKQVAIAAPAEAYAVLKAIPQADRGSSVLFAFGAAPVSGTVPSPDASLSRINTGIDLSVPGTPAWKFIRVYDSSGSNSKASGQIAHIAQGGLQNGFILIDFVWESGSKVVPDSSAAAPNVFESVENRPKMGAKWISAPAAGDKFVLVEDTKMWKSPNVPPNPGYIVWPAAMTVAEVLSDAELERLNTIDIAAILAQARTAVNVDNEMTFVDVPVLYMGDRTKMPSGRSCEAFIPNAVNFQPSAGFLWVAKPESLLVGGVDVFEAAVKVALPTAVYVRDWDLYHRFGGEVHCGSNVKRSIQPDWFVRVPKTVR